MRGRRHREPNRLSHPHWAARVPQRALWKVIDCLVPELMGTALTNFGLPCALEAIRNPSLVYESLDGVCRPSAV